MQHAIRHRFRLFAILLTGLLAPGAALAQSGSAGGSIGNDDKSISGSRSEPRSVEPEAAPTGLGKPDSAEPGRAAPRRAARGGGSNFDGAWVVVSVGCGGTTTGAVMVTSGKIIGQGVTGYVTASGATSSFGVYNGITVRGSGHLSGRSGSGTFRRSDGCGGRWTTTKQ
jgi:hypothetical protein